MHAAAAAADDDAYAYDTQVLYFVAAAPSSINDDADEEDQDDDDDDDDNDNDDDSARISISSSSRKSKRKRNPSHRSVTVSMDDTDDEDSDVKMVDDKVVDDKVVDDKVVDDDDDDDDDDEPLFVCGIAPHNEKRKKVMTDFCKDIISKGGIRNGSTTYPGSNDPSKKNSLSVHFYHEISFYCENYADTISSEKKPVNKIKPLADRDNHIKLQTSHKYEDTNFLSSIRSILCATISSKRNFRGILDRSNRDNGILDSSNRDNGK